MANLNIKDGNGVPRTIKTVETGGVHTPVHRAEGPLTNAELRASSIGVTGPLTDAQLRANPVPVSGPLTDAELRADPVQVEISGVPSFVLSENAHEVPLSCGIHTLTPAGTRDVTIPGTATGVRIFPRHEDIRFNFDAAVGTPANNTLTAGGIAKADQWREVHFDAATYSTLKLASIEAALSGDGSIQSIDIEFVTPA